MRRLAVAGLTIVGLLLAAGCGDDDGGAAPEPEGSGSGSGPDASEVPAGVAAQYAQLAAEIAAEGGETTSGSWRIGYIIEPAEPWFVPEGDDYRFREPADGETHHIEIIPFEAETGRVVPDVPIHLEIIDGNGDVADAKDLNFYYAEFFHYANNFSIPEAGTYTLRAALAPPAFLRHGEHAGGPALAEGAQVEFAGVELDPAG